MEKKLSTPVEILCKGFPPEFSTYLTYTRSLKFDEKPEYSYCKKLFKNLMEKSGIENDQQYDWMPLLNKKMEE
jgi:hypothetical protein